MEMLKKKCVSYKIIFTKHGLEYELITDGNKGTNIYISETAGYTVILHTPLNLKPEIFMSFNKKDIINFSKNFPNVFTLFYFDKKTNDLLVTTDRLGLQAVYYQIFKGKKLIISPLIGKILKESHKKLEIDKDGLFHFLSFGYPFKPAPFIYKNIQRIYQRKLLHFNKDIQLKKETNYIDLPEINSNKNKVDINKIHNLLLNSLKNVTSPFVGVTAGLDSLLVSAYTNSSFKNVKAGNFGYKKSTDVIYGKMLAKKMDFDYTYSSLCDENDFEYYLNEVSYYSSGLATASYVDMLKFVDKAITSNETFLMGEAGESIRDFFVNNSLTQNYLTPLTALSSLLSKSYKNQLEKYPQTILSNFQSKYNPNQEEFYIDFYRNARLPGNFSLRTLILQAKVNKTSPFLDKDFIEYTYGLNLKNYTGSMLHKEIIHHFYPELSTFLNQKTEIDSQIWHERFKNNTGKLILELTKKNYTDFGIEKEPLLNLIQKNIENPDRSVYLILRILSLMRFVKMNSHN